jgi:hypothetical protein
MMSAISINELLGEIDESVSERFGKWGHVERYNDTIVVAISPPNPDYRKINLNSPEARIWRKLENSFLESTYESVLREHNLSTTVERAQPRYYVANPGNYIDIVFDKNGVPVLSLDKVIETRQRAEAFAKIDELLNRLRGRAYVLKKPQQEETHSLLEYIPEGMQIGLEEALTYRNGKPPEWGPKERIPKRRIVKPDLTYIFPETGCNMDVELKRGTGIWGPVEDLKRQLMMYYAYNVCEGLKRNALGVGEPGLYSRREQVMLTDLRKIIDIPLFAQTISTPHRIEKSARARIVWAKRKLRDFEQAQQEAEKRRLHDSTVIFSEQIQKTQIEIIKKEQEEAKRQLEFAQKLKEI